jgi:DNA mismatch repair protein MutS
MHAVKNGPANQSFGLQVAALAGLPKAVIADARKTLLTLEQGMHTTPPANPDESAASSPQMGLFTPPAPSAAEKALAELDPDSLTPREALEALYRLKNMS